MDKYYEFCECGGKAFIKKYNRDIPILKCNRCGDEFEAHESKWKLEN